LLVPFSLKYTVQFTFAIAVFSFFNTESNGNGQKPPKNISAALAVALNPIVLNGKESWLGGLDSNQDSQLQRLMYYRLYDLPAERDARNGPWRAGNCSRPHDPTSLL
jgi:hypothetical protein